MNALAQPATAHLQRTLEVPLTGLERFRLGAQIGAALVAAGLLAVGLLQLRFSAAAMSPVAHLIIALAACIVTLPIAWRAIVGLVTMDPNAFSAQLVALAALAAMAAGDFVTATLVPVIMSLGHFLEERSILGAQAAIEGLQRLHAHKATLLTQEGERAVEPASLKRDDLLAVRPGEMIPVDGRIERGFSAVDQAPITGESAPAELHEGDHVFAGTVNLTGLIRVRVESTGSRTALGRIAELLQEAEQSKTPVLKLIERYARYYVPLVLMIAGVVLFATREMSRAIAVLVVGCPGALILAGPSAMVAALAAASRLGILIKNTRFLESLADIDAVVFDKTGTITLGRLEVAFLRPASPSDENELLRESLSCAIGSQHPICRAIVDAADSRGVKADAPDGSIQEISGKGTVSATANRRRLLGRREWLIDEGLVVPANPEHDGPVAWLGETANPVGDGPGRIIGCVGFADQARPDARQSLSELRLLGADRTILLTGDRREVAQRIGLELGFDEVIAEVLPEQKLAAVCEESHRGRKVMVVGDGINDALALASGDVGVALGAAASDIALKSADVALMTDSLTRIPQAVRLARRTRQTIHQNALMGAGTSLTFIWLACAGIVAPLAGAILHNVGAALVIVNSARLLSQPDSGSAKA